MRNALLLAAAVVLLSSCAIHLTPVRLNELSQKIYIKAGKYCPEWGPYKHKCVALVYYDGIARALVDEQGKALSFHNNIMILNYLAPEGWEYVESDIVEFSEKVKRRVMLLKNKRL